MIEIKAHERSVLSRVGHGPYGKELIDILKKVRAQVSSLEGLVPGVDHNAAVEGRLLFKQYADELIKDLEFEERRHRPNDPEAELGTADYL
jgi:hypothetical protein